MTKHTPPFSPEVRERAVRLVREHESEHGSQWAAIQSIAAKIGCSGETLRNCVRQAERDRGVKVGPATDECGRIKALERENRELPADQRDLEKGIGVPCPGEARPPVPVVITLIGEHCRTFGVEPIRKVLPVAQSTYHVRAARRADRERLLAPTLLPPPHHHEQPCKPWPERKEQAIGQLRHR